MSREACRSCAFWKERRGNVGWCDFNYPTEQRGLTNADHLCQDYHDFMDDFAGMVAIVKEITDRTD